MPLPASHPKYYYVQNQKTLLGGRDISRRTIYQDAGGCGIPICVFNQEMSHWNEERERQLNVVLKALEQDDGN